MYISVRTKIVKMSEELDEIREQRDNKVRGIFNYFSAIMGFFYMVMGAVFYFFPFIPNMDLWAKIALSALLFLYGIFRIKRALWS